MLACGTFGADLNCSESRWGAADPSCAATQTIAHTMRQEAAALQDFQSRLCRVPVIFAASTLSPPMRHVRFALIALDCLRRLGSHFEEIRDCNPIQDAFRAL